VNCDEPTDALYIVEFVVLIFLYTIRRNHEHLNTGRKEHVLYLKILIITAGLPKIYLCFFMLIEIFMYLNI